MRKGILILFMVMAFFVIDIENGYAFGDGYLSYKRGYTLDFHKNNDDTNYNKIIDGDEDTNIHMTYLSGGAKLTVTFDEPIDVDSYKIRLRTFYWVDVYFYDVDGNEIYKRNINTGDKIINVNHSAEIDNVKK